MTTSLPVALSEIPPNFRAAIYRTSTRYADEQIDKPVMRPASTLFLALIPLANAQTYTISTFAGGALPVNIQGPSAGLYGPQSGIATDASGNVFFVDGNTILRLDGVAGVVTLVAGKRHRRRGQRQYRGDERRSSFVRLPVSDQSLAARDYDAESHVRHRHCGRVHPDSQRNRLHAERECAVEWHAAPTTFAGALQLTAYIPASLIATAGSAKILVNSGGTSSAAVTFPINAGPAIATLNPAAVVVGRAGFTLAVSGTGFVSGAQVQWNGAALPTTFVSSTQLTAAISAGLVANVGSVTILVNYSGASSNGAMPPQSTPTAPRHRAAATGSDRPAKSPHTPSPSPARRTRR